jgi:hypothetical protein
MSGCGLLRPVPEGEVNTADAARLIHAAAREGTVLAINKIYEKVSDRVMAAASLKGALDNYTLPLLNNPDKEITVVLADELMEVIPEEWKGLMAVAYETLHLYYEFPATAEALPEPYLTYLKAFFNGVREGAAKVLADEKALERTMLFLPEPTPEPDGE